MHCPECNTNKENRKYWEDILKTNQKTCPCCNGVKNISFHRFVQWNLGWVCWLDGNGKDASVSEMNQRCDQIIKDCYRKVNKKVNRTWNLCENSSMSPSEVMNFFAQQFKGKDCLIKSNY